MPDADETNKTLLCAPRMTGVMARVPVDMNRAMETHVSGAVTVATILCTTCGKTKACDEWLESNLEGEATTPPQFCPNQTFLRSLAPGQK